MCFCVVFTKALWNKRILRIYKDPHNFLLGRESGRCPKDLTNRTYQCLIVLEQHTQMRVLRIFYLFCEILRARKFQ